MCLCVLFLVWWLQTSLLTHILFIYFFYSQEVSLCSFLVNYWIIRVVFVSQWIKGEGGLPALSLLPFKELVVVVVQPERGVVYAVWSNWSLQNSSFPITYLSSSSPGQNLHETSKMDDCGVFWLGFFSFDMKLNFLWQVIILSVGVWISLEVFLSAFRVF